MNGKTCLVTGATSGIGEATARGLAGLGAHVLVHGRDGDKCERVVQAIRAATRNNSVEPILADFRSLADVRAMAEHVNSTVERLDVLVNNAGTMTPGRRLTSEGLDETFAVNHLAPFLLTNLLLPKIKASRPARIVNVSSMLHRMARLNLSDLPVEGPHDWMRGYSRSKLALVLFTRSLARRLAGSGVVANSLHPGTILSREPSGWLGRLLVQTLLRFMLSPDEGARTSLYLATSLEAAEVSGVYFTKCAPVAASRNALADDVAERLWQVSAKLTGC
jgi:NAD(P)-dependent dehydrogenase (short-subunit alcohol dehydrogenase family)